MLQVWQISGRLSGFYSLGVVWIRRVVPRGHEALYIATLVNDLATLIGASVALEVNGRAAD
ncbi:MAG: hypothetical protein JWQ87_123 [Candidatus Sulfotelmatobacter sp.]|nr:hypothetical protein [Candidatus Sulfotelmatobacter sp.]